MAFTEEELADEILFQRACEQLRVERHLAALADHLKTCTSMDCCHCENPDVRHHSPFNKCPHCAKNEKWWTEKTPSRITEDR